MFINPLFYHKQALGFKKYWDRILWLLKIGKLLHQSRRILQTSKGKQDYRVPKFLWELHTKSLFFMKLISKIPLKWQIEHWIAVQNAVIKLGPLSHSQDCTEFYNASPGPWGPGLCGDCHTIAWLAGAGTWWELYRKCVPGRPGLWATLAGTKAGMSRRQNVHSRLCPRYSRDPQGREYSWYVH